MRVSKKVKRAMEKAKKEVIKNAEKPKKKRKVVKKNDAEQQPRTPSGRWIKDEWGTQGEVFFDGKLYWLTLFKQGREPNTWDAIPVGLSEEKWEEYKKKPVKTGLPKERKSGTLATGKQLSSTRQTTSSTKRSKEKPKKKSPTKSGKTAIPTKQVRWQ